MMAVGQESSAGRRAAQRLLTMQSTSSRPLWHKLLLCACVLLLHAGHSYALSLSKDERRLDLQFEHQSADLTREAKDTLRQLVDGLNTQWFNEVIILSGHADAGEAAPEALGLQRARAVEFHLWQLGVYPKLMFVESKGSSLPADPRQSARNRRVELQAVSQHAALPPSQAGFGTMDRWFAETMRGQRPGPEGGPPWPTPYEVLPQVDPALRPRFLRLMQLVAIKNQDDARLTALRAMDDGRLPDGDPVPPALYAQVFGSPYARAATRREADRIAAADPRRVALAQRLWCDQDPYRKPDIERVQTTLPAPAVLQTLPEAQQAVWIACALHSAEALRWLRLQGIRLDAKRQPDGWTALHAAVNDADETVFKALMAAGANARATNHADETPLHRVTHPDGPLLPYASQKLFWEELLQAGADRNAHIADTWPPDLKRRVDTLLALFSSRSTAPTAEEIMAQLNLELQERQPQGYEVSNYVKIYEAHTNGTPAAYRGNWWDYGPFYFISTPSAKGTRTHTFTIPVTTPAFCLNPYELAIYTGASFSGGIPPPPSFQPSQPKPWNNAYAWDMFKSSPVNTYRARDFHIRTLPVRDPQTGKVTDEGCVQTMGVTASFRN